MYIFMFIFFLSFLKFMMNYKFLIISLISMEFIVLMLFFIMYFYFKIMKIELFFLLIFLSFSVCESVLGLSLLISMIRIYGNSYFQLLNSFLC